jgi:signal transduction histidine kinase
MPLFPRVPQDTEEISPERRVQLLDMSYARMLWGIGAMQFVALCMTGFYSLEHNPIRLAFWMAGYMLIFIFSRIQRRAYVRDQAAMPAAAFLARWRPRLETLALVHGLALCAPSLFTIGNASFEFSILWHLVVCAIMAGNATHQTPALGVFMRFFMAGWNLNVLLAFWVYPDRWYYIVPLMLLFSAGIYRHAMIAHRFFVQQVQLEERSVRLAEQFKQAKEDAEKALNEKNLFLATASHDLRQPVHALGMLIEAIAYRSKDPALAPLLTDLRSSVRAVNVMFNSLLDLSKLEAGVVTPKPQQVRLMPLLEDVMTLFRSEAGHRELTLRLVRGLRDPVVLADPGLLRQVMVNLVQNALRYTRAGGVLVGVRRRAAQWQIEVWDTGVGVADEDRDQIFSPYYRQQHAWKIDSAGYGLGLSVVARCAQLMHARYGMTSKLGKGSRFWLQLAAVDDAAPQVEDTVAPLTAGPMQALPPLAGRCLIVEDDPQVASAWAALAAAWQVDVLLAADATQAFAHLDAGFDPQVILCDQRLRSGESGFEVLRALLARCPQAHGAMVSGEFHSPELKAADAQGYRVFLKPVDVAQLHSALSQWFEKRAVSSST